MAANLIEKLLDEAVKTGGTYAKFVVSKENVAFICNGGSRKSTRNYRQSKKEIIADEKILKAITERNLLFSKQLSRIEFTLCDGRTAIFQKDVNDNYCMIKARRVTETKEKTYEYVCFHSHEDNCAGLAFAIKQQKSGKHQIAPCTGEIMNGVKSVGIPTDLRFVISGKFQVKDGATDPWANQVNIEAIEQLSATLKSALKDMMHFGLLGMPLFSVLPNSTDEENMLNTSLLRAATEVCLTYPMFKSRSGRIVNRSKIAYGTDDVTKLFPQEAAGPFLGERYWIRPCESGSREECFLKSIGVPYYDREQFLKRVFLEENIDECGKLLKRQNDKWLREFYIFCSAPLTDSAVKKQIIAGFKSIQSMRDSNGEMHFPHEVNCVTSVKQLSKKSLVVKPELISPSGEDDEYSSQLRDFFLKELGIKEYSQKAEIEELEETISSVEPLDVPNRFLQTEYLVLERDCADEQDYVTQICDKLQQINEILRKANSHVGYRVRDEIVFYMLNNKKAGNLLTEEQAFDNEIMQKILPRIQGSAVSIKNMLIELFKFCMGNQSVLDKDNGNVGAQMNGMADSATYKESAKKIGYMMKRYEEDGFTSYWL